MTEPAFDRNLSDTEDVADYIVSEFAAENSGVAEVISDREIQSHLDDVVVNVDEFEDGEWDDFVIEVKDAVLGHDVIIA